MKISRVCMLWPLLAAAETPDIHQTLDQLTHPDNQVRTEAVQTLNTFPVEALLDHVADPRMAVRWSVMNALEHKRFFSEPLVTKLKAAATQKGWRGVKQYLKLQDHDTPGEEFAAQNEVVTDLSRVLTHQDPKKRRAGVWFLVSRYHFMPTDQQQQWVLSLAIPFLGDPDESVREAAKKALPEVLLPTDLGLFRDALRDENATMRRNAFQLIASFGWREALPMIQAWCGDGDPALRREAIRLLKNYETADPELPLDPETRPALERALKDPSADVRAEAQAALEALNQGKSPPPEQP